MRWPEPLHSLSTLPVHPPPNRHRCRERRGRLNAQTAVVLNIAFHELVTNAAKYGSLSVGGGAVTVVWTVDALLDPAAIEIVWTERGGPPVQPPSRRGFGSHVLETGIAHDLGGQVTIDFQPEGLLCRMRYRASHRNYPVA